MHGSREATRDNLERPNQSLRSTHVTRRFLHGAVGRLGLGGWVIEFYALQEQQMKYSIKFNDAWEMTWPEGIDCFREFFDVRLQPTHPLREYDLYPLAKVERKYKFLVEEMEPSDKLWVLDFENKKRVKGKTCYYFKLIESQEELDALMEQDLEDWKQFMKDCGAWEE